MFKMAQTRHSSGFFRTQTAEKLADVKVLLAPDAKPRPGEVRDRVAAALEYSVLRVLE